MNDQREKDTALSIKADAAFRKAAKKVIIQAVRTDTPIIIWEENRIQEITHDRLKKLLTEAQLEDVR